MLSRVERVFWRREDSSWTVTASDPGRGGEDAETRMRRERSIVHEGNRGRHDFAILCEQKERERERERETELFFYCCMNQV